MMVRVTEARRVRDDPADAAFAETYAALPDATDLDPWLGWARRARPPVLYVGPGAGRLAVPLWHAGVRLVGIDPHPGMVAILRRRLPEMEVIEAPLESNALGDRRFDLVIGPSSILGAELLAAAARHSRRWVGLELMNPHWLAGPGREQVTVHWMTDRQARIDVPYPNGDLQEATVTLRPPEQVEAHLASAGLRLLWMGGRPGLDLAESPTYFVLSAISRRNDGFRGETG